MVTVVAYWNGKFVNPDEPHVPMDERGHQFGDGVYEVVRVYGGRPFLLEMHLERLDMSLQCVGINNPHSAQEWTNIIHEAITHSQEQEALVYWQVTRGIAPRAHGFPSVPPSVSLTVRPFESKSVEQPWLLVLPDERWGNVFVKTINLLPNVLAKQTALTMGATEALLVRNGLVTEGSSSNAWFVRDNEIWTHPANRWILNGISRRHTMALAAGLGYTLVEAPLTWEWIAEVDEVFMTGTTIEVLPIHSIKVDPALESSLMQLPDDASQNLLPQPQLHSLRPVWEQRSESKVASRLRTAYQESIDSFRTSANC